MLSLATICHIDIGRSFCANLVSLWGVEQSCVGNMASNPG